MSILLNKHQEIGDLGEQMFADIVLTRYGFQPNPTTHKHPYDFTINDKRVEVKTANYTPNGYQANLRGHNADDFDLLVFILLSDDPPIWLVIPAEQLTQKKLTIRNKQATGKLSTFRENWEALEQLIGE